MLHLQWEPIPGTTPALQARMERILAEWQFTPYGSGQSLKGVAADCIGFGCGALDELDGRRRTVGAELPPDASLHDRKKSMKAVAKLRRLFHPAFRVRGRKVQPFDLLVAGPAFGGPGHLMLVGPRRNTLWHCSGGCGTDRAGWALERGYETLFAVYRLADREHWLEG